MMNEREVRQSSAETIRTLQKTIGFAMAAGSVGSALFTFIALTSVVGYSTLQALSHYNVWFTSIWIPIGLYTAIAKRRIAQWVQVYAFFIFGSVSAANLDDIELTNLIFFGLGLALGLAYDIFTHRIGKRLTPLLVPYLISVIIGISGLTDSPLIFIALWLTGAGMICTMFWAFFRAVRRELLSRKAHLEEQIRLRTVALEKSLKEAESLRDRNAMLLKELHHRTKNSLQIVASLLSIQQGETQDSRKSVGDILNEAERRVRTMAKTHEMFHQHDGVSVVGIELFVRAIIEGYLRSGLITSLFVETDSVEHVAVDMDVAIPLGLIINELFSNVVQHAYAQDLTDRPVWVFLNYQEGSLTVTIEDHGIGIPESIGTDAPKSGGLRIVRALAGQIDADLSLRRNPFTTWIIRTPLTAATDSEDVEA